MKQQERKVEILVAAPQSGRLVARLSGGQRRALTRVAVRLRPM